MLVTKEAASRPRDADASAVSFEGNGVVTDTEVVVGGVWVDEVLEDAESARVVISVPDCTVVTTGVEKYRGLEV